MKKIIRLIIILLIASLFLSCTQNSRAKTFGGTAIIDLPTGTKLIDATWKNEDLWYLTRKRREVEPIETYEFKEDSSFGVIEGTVIFKEH